MRAVKLLQPGGVMALIVPRYTLDKEFSGWIAAHFERVVAYLAPEQAFRQAVVVGVRADTAPSSDKAREARRRLERVGNGDDRSVLP